MGAQPRRCVNGVRGPTNLRIEAGRIATVDVGKVADLVVVRDDPLIDVEKAMRSLQDTIRAGVARTPDQWMASR